MKVVSSILPPEALREEVQKEFKACAPHLSSIEELFAQVF